MRILTTLEEDAQAALKKSMGNPKVTIKSPANGSRVDHKVPLDGTVEHFPINMELWVVNRVSGSYHPDDGPIVPEGKIWNSFAYVGNSAPGSDSGTTFTIHIVEVSHDTGEKIFKRYLNNAHQTGNWSGISTIGEGKIVATVSVTRN